MVRKEHSPTLSSMPGGAVPTLAHPPASTAHVGGTQTSPRRPRTWCGSTERRELTRELTKHGAPTSWSPQPLGPDKSTGSNCDNKGLECDAWPIPPWTRILTTGKLHHSLSFHPSTGQQLLPKVRHLQTTRQGSVIPQGAGGCRPEQAGGPWQGGRESEPHVGEDKSLGWEVGKCIRIEKKR